MQPRINLITLGVSDFKASVAFYKDVLKLPYSKRSQGDVAFFELNGTWLALHPRAALAADAGIPAEGTGFSGITLSQNMRSRASIDKTFSDLKAAGVRILKAPTVTDWGGYNGYFTDPDGHLWEVCYNPAFWPGPK